MRRWRCLRIQGCFWCSIFFFGFEHVPIFFGFKQMFMSYLWNTEILENKNPNVSWCCFCDSENQSFPGFVSRTWRFWSQSWFLTSQQIRFHRSAHKTEKNSSPWLSLLPADSKNPQQQKAGVFQQQFRKKKTVEQCSKPWLVVFTKRNVIQKNI